MLISQCKQPLKKRKVTYNVGDFPHSCSGILPLKVLISQCKQPLKKRKVTYNVGDFPHSCYIVFHLSDRKWCRVLPVNVFHYTHRCCRHTVDGCNRLVGISLTFPTAHLMLLHIFPLVGHVYSAVGHPVTGIFCCTSNSCDQVGLVTVVTCDICDVVCGGGSYGSSLNVVTTFFHLRLK